MYGPAYAPIGSDWNDGLGRTFVRWQRRDDVKALRESWLDFKCDFLPPPRNSPGLELAICPANAVYLTCRFRSSPA